MSIPQKLNYFLKEMAMTNNNLKINSLDTCQDYSQTLFINEQNTIDELSANFDPLLEPEMISILQKNCNSLTSDGEKLATPTQKTIIDIDFYRTLYQ